MAELVGIVSGAITFAAFAAQVGKSVQTLKSYWDSMRDVPDDLRLLLREIEILGFIMADVDADLSRRSVSLGLINCQHASQSLNFCKDAAEELEALCKDLLRHVDSSSGLRRSYQLAKLAIRERKIEKHVSKLHNVVRLLMLSQQCYTRAVIQAQPKLVAEEMRNLGLVSSHTAVAEPHYDHLAPTRTVAERRKVGKERANHRKSRFWLLRAPYWMSSRVLEISGMKTPSGWDWSLRTYNEVRLSSELDYCLKQGSVRDLQNLFASGQVSPRFRAQGSGRSLLHYAICVDRNEQMVEFLLDQGVDPSIEAGLLFSTPKTPLRIVLEIGREAASNKLYPLLPFLRPLLRHAPDLVYENAQEAVEGILSEFHGTSEEFMFLQQHCCPMFYQMPAWARITVAAKIVFDARYPYYAEEANNIPNLVKMIIGNDTLEAQHFQANCTLPLALKGTTLIQCVAKRLGNSMGFLLMSRRWDLVVYEGYQKFFRPPTSHCHAKWQAIYESWKGLFFDLLQVKADVHQIVDGRTLFIAFLEGYLAAQVTLPQFNQFLWLGVEDFQVGIRTWLKDMTAAGLDLEVLGASERRIWKSGNVQREFNNGLHRVTGIRYGPSPEDWYIWLAEPSDSFVGDFWALVARPAETLPGQWPDE